jgi:hypothetical protein
MMLVLFFVLPGRCLNSSTTRLTRIAAAGLAQDDSPPQIPG